MARTLAAVLSVSSVRSVAPVAPEARILVAALPLKTTTHKIRVR